MVAVAGEVGVGVVSAERHHLVEEPGDRHLRRRRLSQDWRGQHRDGDEGEECDDEEIPHYRLLSCGEQPTDRSIPPPPTSPKTTRHTPDTGDLRSQRRSKG